MPERWQHELRKLKALEPPSGLWHQATQGPRRPGRERARARRTWPAIVAALAITAVAAAAFGLVNFFGPGGTHPAAAPRRPAQITLQMRPAMPLTMSGCVAQAEHYGRYTANGAARICAPDRQRNRWNWYHAVLTNKGPGAYPACQATGFDAHGTAVGHWQLFFQFGGAPTGLYAKRNSSASFSWYLPGPKRRAIVRYTATCSVNSHPAV